MSDKMREEFEAWYKGIGSLVCREADGNYSFQHTRYAWQAWQASRAAMVQEGWQLVPAEPTENMISESIDAGRFDEDDAVFFWSSMLAAAPKP